MTIKKLGKKIGVLLLAASTFASSSICSAGEAESAPYVVREVSDENVSVKSVQAKGFGYDYGSLKIDKNNKVYCTFTADNKKTIGVTSFDGNQNLVTEKCKVDMKKLAKKMKCSPKEIKIDIGGGSINNMYVTYTHEIDNDWHTEYSYALVGKNEKIKGRINNIISKLKLYDKGKKNAKVNKNHRYNDTMIEDIKVSGNKLYCTVSEYRKKDKSYIVSEQVFSFKSGKRLASKIIRNTLEEENSYSVDPSGIYKSSTDSDTELLVPGDMITEVQEDPDLLSEIVGSENIIVMRLYMDECDTPTYRFILIKLK